VWGVPQFEVLDVNVDVTFDFFWIVWRREGRDAFEYADRETEEDKAD
jgi:hypothetical protein